MGTGRSCYQESDKLLELGGAAWLVFQTYDIALVARWMATRYFSSDAMQTDLQRM